MTLELDESERQMVLMALAHLSIERPGWDDALNRIALRIDNESTVRAPELHRPDDRSPRAAMFDGFREIHRYAIKKDPA